MGGMHFKHKDDKACLRVARVRVDDEVAVGRVDKHARRKVKHRPSRGAEELARHRQQRRRVGLGRCARQVVGVARMAGAEEPDLDACASERGWR